MWLPNKYLPIKDAAIWDDFRSNECPVFVFGVGIGLSGLNVTFHFNLVGLDFVVFVDLLVAGEGSKLMDGWV